MEKGKELKGQKKKKANANVDTEHLAYESTNSKKICNCVGDLVVR